MSAPSMPGALDGLNVVDFSRVLAGPFCAAMLGDMGADVIKVEGLEGDESRAWVPRRDGESAGYLVNNRNKRGIALDLKSPEGVEIALALVARADVVVENFRTGAMEKFGLGYERLAALNPRLIYCSVSAFGRTGPRADEAGYEALMQAFSGVMAVTGEADGAPVRAGPSFIDLGTGMLCAFGVVSALQHRARTGVGQRVDGALFNTALAMLNYHAQGVMLADVEPGRMGSAHPSIAPYRNYRCRDGRWVFIAGANDRLAGRMLGALGLGWCTTDPRFVTNGERVRHRVELDRLVEDAVAGHDRDELIALLAAAGSPAAPVNSVSEALSDEQARVNHMLWPMDHPATGTVPVVGMPLRFSAMGASLRRPAPMLGEHTDEVLGELGYDAPRIAALRDAGVIG